ncbi:MAG: hypothetical protein L3K19_09230 [Thermoplasmata archaeon]|nr:hypothetical protein [Thermoplasmata archaeon]
MPEAINFDLGILILALALSMGGWAAFLTARFSRGGAVVESMMQRSFLPEKQRAYLAVLSVEGSMLLNSGIVWGLGSAGILPAWLVTWLVAAFLGVGMVCVGEITWLGLRPSRLTAHERVALRNRALYSLVLVPMASDMPEP